MVENNHLWTLMIHGLMEDFRIPISIIDNFLYDPDSFVDYSKKLSFIGPTESHNFPGIRCNIHNEDIINAVLSVFFPVNENTRWRASMGFQITNSDLHKGWIHQDNDTLMAFILYLNKNPDPESGTSIFKRIKIDKSIDTEDTKNIKRLGHKGKIPQDKKYFDTLDQWNSQFEETLEVKNQYNRLLVFDHTTYHGVKKYVDDRLTFCGFINELSIK